MDRQRLSEMFNAACNAMRPSVFMPATKALILETPAEVLIGAVLGAMIGFGNGYAHEAAKRGQIPLAFCEYSALVLEHETLGGRQLPPLTEYYCVTNDMVMQVFEASNLSYTQWFTGSDDRFAYELEKKIEPTMRIHTLYSDHSANMPAYADAAQAAIAPLTAANRDLVPVIEALDNAWDESHRDVYKTVYYQEMECTGSGESESCSMVTKSRQEYDYTIHDYDYHPEWGRRAAELMHAYTIRHPDIRIGEAMLEVTKTEAENEWAMRESRRRLPGYEPLKQEDYLRLANTWRTGSNYMRLTPSIYRAHGAVVAAAPEWARARLNARSDRYTSRSRSDDGPREFQMAEAALANATSASRDITRVSSGITYTAGRVMPLQDKMWAFVNAELHGGDGNPRQLRREIMQEARDVYKRNFAGGFDTHPAKWEMAALKAFLGLLIGGLLGLGADRLTTTMNNRNIWPFQDPDRQFPRGAGRWLGQGWTDRRRRRGGYSSPHDSFTP